MKPPEGVPGPPPEPCDCPRCGGPATRFDQSGPSLPGYFMVRCLRCGGWDYWWRKDFPVAVPDGDYVL